jgi:SAM-dependent methyltransferase
MRHEFTSQGFFENKYRQDIDPWNFESSPYEKERYAAILRTLRNHGYSSAFEPGCSIGVLTQALARYCSRLEAVDISPTAVVRAQARCKDLLNVHIQCGSLPEAIPDGEFDLVVFSEIGYYFERRELEKITQELCEKLIPGGTLIAAHWLGTSADHLLSGDQVHESIRENDNLSLDKAERYRNFRLDRMVRR